jgi:hypothetical protein
VLKAGIDIGGSSKASVNATGGIDIDVERAHRAIEVQIARPLGMSVLEAALGLLQAPHAVGVQRRLRLDSVPADAAGTSLLAGGQPPSGPAPSPRRRPICLDARRGLEDVDVWRRADLPVGFSFTGPAIVEQADTTTLVYPGHRATVDGLGNILIDVPLPE